MDSNTAGVLAIGILLGMPAICMTAFGMLRLILEHREELRRRD